MPPLPGALVQPGGRSAARVGAVLRRDGQLAGAGGIRPGRPAGVRELRVPRRHPRRARVDLRGIGHRDQDLVRHVPAALDHQLRRARGRGAQHQGADLQRQGRGPAVPRLRQQQADRRASERGTPTLGLPARPFGNVRVFAPPRQDDPPGTPDVHARDRAVSPFYWTLAEFCEEELLPFVFADAEDERAQYTMLIAQVAARLRRDAVPAGDRRRGQDPRRGPATRSSAPSATWSTLLETELGDDGTRGSWVAGSTVMGSVNALLRRLRSAVPPLQRDRPRRPGPPRRALDQHVARPGDGHRPAQPAGPGAAVRGRRDAARPSSPARNARARRAR